MKTILGLSGWWVRVGHPGPNQWAQVGHSGPRQWVQVGHLGLWWAVGVDHPFCHYIDNVINP